MFRSNQRELKLWSIWCPFCNWNPTDYFLESTEYTLGCPSSSESCGLFNLACCCRFSSCLYGKSSSWCFLCPLSFSAKCWLCFIFGWIFLCRFMVVSTSAKCTIHGKDPRADALLKKFMFAVSSILWSGRPGRSVKQCAPLRLKSGSSIVMKCVLSKKNVELRYLLVDIMRRVASVADL